MISDLADADLTRIYNQANNIAAGEHVPITTQRIFAAMRTAMASANERADYAWRNTHTIEKARQEEMIKRDRLLAVAKRFIAEYEESEEDEWSREWQGLAEEFRAAIAKATS